MALSVSAKRDLEQFIAANGENYSMYEEFAKQRGWKVWTKGYLHNWVNRNRPNIQTYRAVHREVFRKSVTLDREMRLKRMERAADKIEQEIETCTDTEIFLKLVESQRKVLQHIAQERGEWNKPVESDAPAPFEELMRRMAGQLPAPKDVLVEEMLAGDVIEGEVRELEQVTV